MFTFTYYSNYGNIGYRNIMIMEQKNMTQLPKEPVILLSFINTQLRDNFNTLTELCKSYSVDKHFIIDTLKTIDYEYDSHINQFI